METVSETQTHSVSPFSEFEFRSYARVFIKPGDRPSITLEGEGRLLDLFRIDQTDGKLTLTTSDPVEFGLETVFNLQRLQVKVTVTYTDKLETVVNRGAGNFFLSFMDPDKDLVIENRGVGDIVAEVHARSIKADLMGVGSIILRGKASQLDFRLHGSGKLDAKELVGISGSVTCSGIGVATVHLTDSLKARLNGLGSIRFRGRPKLDKDITGIGTIEPVD
ncbi:MAG: DUF2807 domain-containing protein [Bacteroidota bacterium]|nr:DUF2807 domain-containing protein [Bacteroidota bacterium]MDX5447610.1 DUF2807 domain-containing protein [Bacteroidota bacterium]